LPFIEEDDLFSPSSIGRYGQWEISDDWLSEDEEPRTETAREKYDVELAWRKMLEQRKKEASGLLVARIEADAVQLDKYEWDFLVRKYPYHIFRQDILGYIHYDILGNAPTSSVSAKHWNTRLT
jgi:hypothetical protein